jgi:hypothetical protein
MGRSRCSQHFRSSSSLPVILPSHFFRPFPFQYAGGCVQGVNLDLRQRRSQTAKSIFGLVFLEFFIIAFATISFTFSFGGGGRSLLFIYTFLLHTPMDSAPKRAGHERTLPRLRTDFLISVSLTFNTASLRLQQYFPFTPIFDTLFSGKGK